MELDFLQRYMVKGQGAQVIARAVCQRWGKKKNKKELSDVGKGAYRGCAKSDTKIFKTWWDADVSKPAESSKGLPEIPFNLNVTQNIS